MFIAMNEFASVISIDHIPYLAGLEELNDGETHAFFSVQRHTVQETNWDAQREKACVNTYAHASASQICLQNICGQQQNFPMAGPTFGSKSGPQKGAQAKT